MIIMDRYYLGRLKEQIQTADDAVLKRYGFSKEDILLNGGEPDEKGVLYGLWRDYQKNVEDYEMSEYDAFHDAMESVFGIPEAEFTEPEIDGGYYYCLDWFRSRDCRGSWVIRSDRRYSAIETDREIHNEWDADDAFLDYLVANGFLMPGDANQVYRIRPVDGRYDLEKYLKTGAAYGGGEK